MKKLFIAVIFSFIVFMSCNDATEPTEPVVYVGGSFKDNGQDKACYWVNGERLELDGVEVKSITAVKGEVYAAGYYKDGDDYMACYWVNGERYDLPGLVYEYYGIGRISIDKGNVYVSGTTDDGLRYWVNGVLQNPPSDGIMRDVYAVNGKVYIPGYYSDGSVIKACYWVNGVRQELPGSEGFFAGIFAFEHNKIYIGGKSSWFLDGRPMTEDITCHWANGKQYIYPEIKFIIAFAVSEGDIYMMGQFGCFKNGKYHSEDRERYYTRFAVSRGKVYIAITGYLEVDGEEHKFYGYTVDGEEHPLDGVPYCIYVE